MHALLEATRANLIPRDIEHPHFVWCQCKNEAKLRAASDVLRATGLEIAGWSEPDRNDELTAICCAPVYGEQRRAFRKFQLIKFPTPASSHGDGSRCAIAAGSVL